MHLGIERQQQPWHVSPAQVLRLADQRHQGRARLPQSGTVAGVEAMQVLVDQHDITLAAPYGIQQLAADPQRAATRRPHSSSHRLRSRRSCARLRPVSSRAPRKLARGTHPASHCAGSPVATTSTSR